MSYLRATIFMGKHVETKYNIYFYHINSSLKGDMKEKCILKKLALKLRELLFGSNNVFKIEYLKISMLREFKALKFYTASL